MGTGGVEENGRSEKSCLGVVETGRPKQLLLFII